MDHKIHCHTLLLIAVLADAIAFVVIVGVDVALPGWIYPFIFYVQVASNAIIIAYNAYGYYFL